MSSQRNVVLLVIVRVVVVVVVLVVGLATFGAFVRTKPTPGRNDRANEAPRVLVMHARPVAVQRQWTGYGTAAPRFSADIPARVTATVIDRPDEIVAGAAVRAGDLIAELDASDFERQREIATQAIADIEAQLTRLAIEEKSWQRRIELVAEQVQLAQAEYDRAALARERQVAAQREVDQAQQALIAAVRDEVGAREEFDKLPARRAGLQAQRLAQESQQRIAAQNVERCRITSPLDGVLQFVDVELGENVMSGQRVARVVDLGRIEVLLRLPAGARPWIRPGDAVLLESTNSSGRRWPARVDRVAPEDDERSRTMGVYVEVEQDPRAPGGLAPGQFLRGRVQSSTSEERWVVPRRAIEKDRLLLVQNGVVVHRPITVDYQFDGLVPQLGLPDEHWVVLVDPLPDDVAVVTVPTRALHDGLAVEPVTAAAAARAEPTAEPGSPARAEEVRP